MPSHNTRRIRSDAARLECVKDALRQKATPYNGEVLLVPSAQALGESIGRTAGFLYGIGAGRADGYEHTLETATGLSVIHKGGLVLAGEVGEGYSRNVSLSEIQKLTKNLSPKQKAELIGSLSLSLAKQDN